LSGEVRAGLWYNNHTEKEEVWNLRVNQFLGRSMASSVSLTFPSRKKKGEREHERPKKGNPDGHTRERGYH